MQRVLEVDKELETIITDNFDVLKNSKLMQNFTYDMQEKELRKRNAKLKKKVLAIEDINWEFNPNSNAQLAALIHDFIGFEVLATTPTGQPAVGGDEIKGHINRTSNQDVIEVLQAILSILDAAKIRNTFVAKYLEADECNGWHYLFGNFVVGGTISSRLSSNNPNLMNQPSKGKMGKLIKSCFQPPKGKLFVCSDFSALITSALVQ